MWLVWLIKELIWLVTITWNRCKCSCDLFISLKKYCVQYFWWPMRNYHSLTSLPFLKGPLGIFFKGSVFSMSALFSHLIWCKNNWIATCHIFSMNYECLWVLNINMYDFPSLKRNPLPKSCFESFNYFLSWNHFKF